jgi:bifunctional non-homologous end joining protein LigD
MRWVKPELVAQIQFVEWNAEGRLRHAAFRGLRSDKSANAVRRE